MTPLKRPLGVLGLATVPLLVLTVLAFFHGGHALPPLEYQRPKVDDFAAASAATAKLIKPVAAALGGDPAGISTTEGDPDLVLPAELVNLLVEAEKACRSSDIDFVANVGRNLEVFAKERLGTVEKIRPSGGELATAVRLRESTVLRHGVWLQNRTAVAKELKACADAISAGPEIEGENTCLELLRQLNKHFPAIADASAAENEPHDALTTDEAAVAKVLQRRAVFRRNFFMNKKASSEAHATATVLKQRLEAWNALITETEKTPTDSRDASLAEQMPALRTAARLRYLEAVAIEQRSAEGLLRSVAAWLDEANKARGDRDDARARAAGLVASWLTTSVAVLPEVPFEEGMQEGFRPGDGAKEGKRVFGFFTKVPNTERQYRWWSDGKSRRDPRLAKGEDQLNLEGDPRDPTYTLLFRRYTKARDRFLESGHGTPEGVNAFVQECGDILEACERYRKTHAEDGQRLDAAAAGWVPILTRSRDAASQLLAAGNATDIWNLLSRPGGSR